MNKSIDELIKDFQKQKDKINKQSYWITIALIVCLSSMGLTVVLVPLWLLFSIINTIAGWII